MAAAFRVALRDEGMVEDEGLMDVLPDAIVQQILCFVKSARDVAACLCVCKRWKELMVYVPDIYFPRNTGVKGMETDVIVTRTVLNMSALQNLIVYCPISAISLLACLSHTKNTLKVLELRVDTNDEKISQSSLCKLDYISMSHQLHTLKLWGGAFAQCPHSWRNLRNLQRLEIVGARISDPAVRDLLNACPSLKDLSLLGCDGVRFLSIHLELLERCRLDFCGSSKDCCITIHAPKLEFLEVQGASCLRLLPRHLLRHLVVAKHSGKMCQLDVGKLPKLKHLSIKGLQWRWEAIEKVLQSAYDVEDLMVRIEFCGDGDKYEPFPEIDFVDFFSSHPKLKRFEAHGAMFAALSHKAGLSQVKNLMKIDSVEEAYITVRSGLNGEQKLAMVESLVKCCPSLRKLVLRASQMKSHDGDADDFFFKLMLLERKYPFITLD